MEKITKRGLIGRFYNTYEARSLEDLDKLAFKVESDQAFEEYAWLGAAPAPRRWKGGRQMNRLKENSFIITNEKFESSILIPRDHVQREKYGQIMVRVDEMGEKAVDHVGELLTDVIESGESTECYDGQYFFDTDHEEGDSGVQSNDLTIDLSDMAIPTDLNTADATAPTPPELAIAIMRLIRQIIGFKDDKGSFMNRNARKFLVKVPLPYMESAMAALSQQYFLNAGANPIQNPLFAQKFQIDLDVDPALSWTTKLAVFRTDGRAKPFIWQEEEMPVFDFHGDGSEFCTFNDAFFFGYKQKRNVGFGYWQHGCLGTLQA